MSHLAHSPVSVRPFSLRREGVLLLAAGATLSLFACSTPSGPAPALGQTHAAVVQYDGEKLFRAIFFGNELSETVLPEVWGPEVVQDRPPAATSIGKQLAVDALLNASKQFADTGHADAAKDLENAANALAAGDDPIQNPILTQDDIVVVQDAMVEAIKTADPDFFGNFGVAMQSGQQPIVQKALEDAGAQLVRFTLNPPGQGLKAGAKVTVAAYVAAVVNAVAICNVFLVTDVAVAMEWVATIAVFIPLLKSNGGQLPNDVIVNDLTLRLAAK